MEIRKGYLWTAVLFFLILIVGQLSSCLMDVTPFWESFSDKVKNP